MTKLDPKLPRSSAGSSSGCLSKDPEERYSSTKDLAKELQNLRAHLSEAVSAADVVPGETPRLRRRVPFWALAAVAALAVARSLRGHPVRSNRISSGFAPQLLALLPGRRCPITVNHEPARPHPRREDPRLCGMTAGQSSSSAGSTATRSGRSRGPTGATASLHLPGRSLGRLLRRRKAEEGVARRRLADHSLRCSELPRRELGGGRNDRLHAEPAVGSLAHSSVGRRAPDGDNPGCREGGETLAIRRSSRTESTSSSISWTGIGRAGPLSYRSGQASSGCSWRTPRTPGISRQGTSSSLAPGRFSPSRSA